METVCVFLEHLVCGCIDWPPSLVEDDRGVSLPSTLLRDTDPLTPAGT